MEGGGAGQSLRHRGAVLQEVEGGSLPGWFAGGWTVGRRLGGVQAHQEP